MGKTLKYLKLMMAIVIIIQQYKEMLKQHLYIMVAEVHQKRFTAIRPVMGSNADLPVSIGFDVDFNDGTSVYTPSSATTTGSEWDTATWDTATWGGTVQTQKVWRSVADIGWNAAIKNTNKYNCSIY